MGNGKYLVRDGYTKSMTGILEKHGGSNNGTESQLQQPPQRNEGPVNRDLIKLVHFHGVKSMQPESVDLNEELLNLAQTCSPVSCQVCRSLGGWSGGLFENSIASAYEKLISQAQFFVWIENQFFISGMNDDNDVQNRVIEALFQRICKANEQGQAFKVYVFLPLLPSFEGPIDGDGNAGFRSILFWQYRTICRGESSLKARLLERGIEMDEYVSFFSLRTYEKVPMSDRIATEMIYIHSKVLIVDDSWCIIGSANINDRSMLGRRDSEIAVLFHDTVDFETILLGGSQYKAGSFCHRLRMKLMREHLGLPTDCDKILVDEEWGDVVSNSVYNKIRLQAKKNSEIFTEVFGCVPSNVVKDFKTSTWYVKFIIRIIVNYINKY